jgi:outer membrane protein
VIAPALIRRTPLAIAIGLLGCLASGPLAAQSNTPALIGNPSLRMSQGLSVPASTVEAASAPRNAPMTGNPPLLERAGEWSPQSTSCAALSADALQSLSLTDALAHTLCKSPAVRQALLAIQGQTASVDIARSAFRPQLFLSSELAGNHTPSSNINAASDSSSMTTGVSLSWMLFDFGVRSANLEQARQTLASVLAAQDATLLATITDTLRIYADAATAWMGLDALREAEAVAGKSLQAAQAKYEAQVGSLSEKLQAQTALAQARLDRVRAEGLWETARGTLAVAMGFAVSQPIGLASLEMAFPAVSGELQAEQLLDEARLVHPRLRGLRSDIKALQARLDSVKSGNWGTINLTGSAFETRGLGAGASNPPDRRLSGSVYLSVPLFNGLQQRALESQSTAQIGDRQAALSQAERDIETNLWQAAQQVRTETQNAAAARQLLASSQLGYQVAFGRYKAGVGSILELLTAQAAQASATNQVNQSLLALAKAKLQLSVSTGRFGARP